LYFTKNPVLLGETSLSARRTGLCSRSIPTSTGWLLPACCSRHSVGRVGALRLCRTIRYALRPASLRVTEWRCGRG